jgi:hypothetical protein
MPDRETAAALLEQVALRLQIYAKMLRGEATDNTGRGYWNITCSLLEQAVGYKVLPLEQYNALLDLAEEAIRSRKEPR